MLIVLGTALLWIELNQPIRTVRVAGGLTVAERHEVRDAISSSLGEGLLGIDLASVRADIRALSWPREVTVRRLWPAGLEVQVEKDLALAVWGNDGYLTSDGRVMQFPDVLAGLPAFLCARSSPRDAMEIYGRLRQTLTGTGVEISTLRETELGEWEVDLDSGVRVVLGRDGLVERMHRFRLVYERALQDQLERVRYVDARYANGVAVRWEETLVAYGGKTQHGI